jgi:hypothetical protein
MTQHHTEMNALRALQLEAALEAFACGDYDDEALTSAAGRVIGSTVPLDPDLAVAITRMTGAIGKLKTYDAAGRALQGWLAARKEAGVRD